MAKLKSMLFLSFTLCLSGASQSKSGDDRGPNLRGSWPTTMTLHVLRDEGLVDAAQIDESGTQTERLASEKVGNDLWNQIYFVRFKLRTGKTVEAIARVSASSDADMRSGPVVYVVSKVLQPEGKAVPPQR
jgi:hypothetical protein